MQLRDGAKDVVAGPQQDVTGADAGLRGGPRGVGAADEQSGCAGQPDASAHGDGVVCGGEGEPEATRRVVRRGRAAPAGRELPAGRGVPALTALAAVAIVATGLVTYETVRYADSRRRTRQAAP